MKIYFKQVNIPKEFYRYNKLSTKHFKTNVNLITILPIYLYKNIEVYNGKKYIPVNITKKKIGFYLRDFLFRNFLKSKKKKEFNIKIFK